MSTTMTDVSNRLGEYMLKGWVLTDRSCATRGCNVPLMRSPSGTVPVVHFCANCDGSPDAKHRSSDSASSGSSSSQHLTISRSSTPPTEVSSAPSSPTFVETPEIRHRREQSDRASAEIGNRLLRGWAMLGEECPNSQCFGVPLVRPPNVGGEKDPRKECVICGGVYLSERDGPGRERLVPVPIHTSTSRSVDTMSGSRPNASASDQPKEAVAASIPSSNASMGPTSNLPTGIQRADRSEVSTQQGDTGTTQSALNTTVQALELTLISLSSRLTSLASPPVTADPLSLSSISDAISKVTQALSQVRQLQRSERQALSLL